MKRLLFFIPILFIGCTSLGPKFDAIQSAIKDRAVIYVYRPTAFTGSLRSPDIIFNGKKVGKIANGGYFSLEVAPGPLVIAMRNFAGEVTGTFEAHIKSGKNYFLRVDLDKVTYRYPYDSSGRKVDGSCPSSGMSSAVSAAGVEFLKAMDLTAQLATCWPGFMFVSRELAERELPETKLSQ